MNTSTKKFFSINEDGLLVVAQGEGSDRQTVTLNVYEFDWLIAHSSEIHNEMSHPCYAGDE